MKEYNVGNKVNFCSMIETIAGRKKDENNNWVYCFEGFPNDFYYSTNFETTKELESEKTGKEKLRDYTKENFSNLTRTFNLTFQYSELEEDLWIDCIVDYIESKGWIAESLANSKFFYGKAHYVFTHGELTTVNIHKIEKITLN